MKTSWKRELILLALLTTGAVSYRIYDNLEGSTFQQGLQDAEAQMKQRLPMKVNEITTLVDVKYEPTKTIYWYVMDIMGEQVVDADTLEEAVKKDLCENQEALRTIREKKFIYEYHYADKERRPIADFSLAECP